MICLIDFWNSWIDGGIVDRVSFLFGKDWNYFGLKGENLYFVEIRNLMVDDSRSDLCYFLYRLPFIRRFFLNYFSYYFNLYLFLYQK